jgi:hypothetical protein
LSTQIVFAPEERAWNRSPFNMLKDFTSHCRQSSVFAQKRIGIRAMRKYTFASSANGSLYRVRRFIMSRFPSRTRSETELTFNESTSLSAAALRALGMRRAKDSFAGETPCGNAMMFIKPDIFDSIRCDRSP